MAEERLQCFKLESSLMSGLFLVFVDLIFGLGVVQTAKDTFAWWAYPVYETSDERGRDVPFCLDGIMASN